jgi:ketosteroid isomerase-like protein
VLSSKGEGPTLPKWTQEQLKRQVKNAVLRIFDAARNRDFATLGRMHLHSDEFSKFDDSAPFRRQDIHDASVHEEAAYSTITDFTFNIEDLKVDIFGNVAVATFYLDYSGIFVNDYRFEGSPVKSTSRVTMVFIHKREEWFILHEHFSQFPREGGRGEHGNIGEKSRSTTFAKVN